MKTIDLVQLQNETLAYLYNDLHVDIYDEEEIEGPNDSRMIQRTVKPIWDQTLLDPLRCIHILGYEKISQYMADRRK